MWRVVIISGLVAVASFDTSAKCPFAKFAVDVTEEMKASRPIALYIDGYELSGYYEGDGLQKVGEEFFLVSHVPLIESRFGRCKIKKAAGEIVFIRDGIWGRKRVSFKKIGDSYNAVVK